MTPTHPTSGPDARAGYIPVLDGLRAVSIGLVVFGHLLMSGQVLRPLGRHYHAFGAVGVSVFFVISGYLITSLLLREERDHGRVDVRAFYARRALRLLPAFYLYLGVVVVLWSAGRLPDNPWHGFVAALLYVRNYVGRGYETGHIWSLSIEEQFYLAWPFFLAWTAPRRARATLLLIAAVCAWRAVRVVWFGVTAGELYTRTDLRADTILVGCLLAFAESSATVGGLSRFLARGWVALAAAGGLVAWNGWIADRVPYAGAVDTLVSAVLIAAVVAWFLLNPGASASRALSGRGVVYVGRLSYSLYLWQQLFLAAPTGGLAAVRTFPVSLILAAAAAVASYHGVERPFLRLKARAFTRR